MPGPGDLPEVTVVTINILRDLSRWPERGPLLVADLADLQPDLIALQEVSLPANSARWLAERLNAGDRQGRPYTVHLCPKRSWESRREGIAVLSRLPVERETTLDLRGQNRVVQCVQVNVDGRPLIFPTPLARRPEVLLDAAKVVLNLLVNRTLRPWRGTLDYIFVSPNLRVVDCEVAFNRPAPHDPTLFPSDHFGLAARLELCT